MSTLGNLVALRHLPHLLLESPCLLARDVEMLLASSLSIIAIIVTIVQTMFETESLDEVYISSGERDNHSPNPGGGFGRLLSIIGSGGGKVSSNPGGGSGSSLSMTGS